MPWLSAHLERGQFAWRLAAAALAFAAALFIGLWVYRGTVFTTDENSYLFQATAFSEGLLRRAPPPHPLEQILHRSMNVIDPQLGWFSRYPPGHALWLLPGVKLGWPRLMPALAAALSLWLLTGAARTLRAPWWLAALLLLLSPYFLFMHGTLLSHTSGLLATSLLLWAYLRWREGGPVRYTALAGAAWAFLFLGRPYTAALLVPAFALDALVLWLRRRDRATFQALAVFGAAALAGPLLSLLYNDLVTGHTRQTPYLMYSPGAALGFHGRHTLAVGLGHLRHNFALLDTWLLGFRGATVGLALCALAAASPLALLAGLAIAAVLGGYVLFYYPGFNTCGPYYYFETLPFWILAALLFARRAARWPRVRRTAPVLLAAAAGFSLHFTWNQCAHFRQRTAREAALMAAIRTAPPNAVVLTVDENYPKGDDLEVRLRPNLRGLDSDPLVMRSLAEGDAILAPFFPGRTLLRLRNTDPPRFEALPDPPPPYADRIKGSTTHGATGRGNGAGDEAAWCRTATPADAPGFLAFGRFRIVPAGRVQVMFDLTVSNVPPEKPLVLTVLGGPGHEELARREISGTLDRAPVEVVLETAFPTAVEPRIYYSGAGTATFRSISLAAAEAQPADPVRAVEHPP